MIPTVNCVSFSLFFLLFQPVVQRYSNWWTHNDYKKPPWLKWTHKWNLNSVTQSPAPLNHPFRNKRKYLFYSMRNIIELFRMIEIVGKICDHSDAWLKSFPSTTSCLIDRQHSRMYSAFLIFSVEIKSSTPWSWRSYKKIWSLPIHAFERAVNEVEKKVFVYTKVKGRGKDWLSSPELLRSRLKERSATQAVS